MLQWVGQKLSKIGKKAKSKKVEKLARQGMRQINKRAKVLKIATRDGWRTASLYEREADALASDTDDERRLKEARRLAESKPFRGSARSTSNLSCKEAASAANRAGMDSGRVEPNGVRLAGGTEATKQSTTGNRVCYMCRREGHFAAQCPARS